MIALEDRVGKTCCRCKEFKEFKFFYKASKRFDGYQTMCKACDSIVSCARHASNPDKNSNAKLYRNIPENKVKAKKYHANLYQNNLESMRARNLKWARDNKDIMNFLCAKRRAVKKKATPSWASDEWESFLVKEIYHLATLRDKFTKFKWHVDHIVPLQSDIVCGLHCSANLQILEASENLSKHNTWWENMP